MCIGSVGDRCKYTTMDTDGKDSEVYRRWDDGFLVRRMRREDVRQVYKWIESIYKVVSDSFPQFHLAMVAICH